MRFESEPYPAIHILRALFIAVPAVLHVHWLLTVRPAAGTPIQNDLMELHALFDYVCPDLLGDRKGFRMYFERPITAGNDKACLAAKRPT